MINYELLARSVPYYEEKGFTPIDAPWWVPTEILQITKPPDLPEGEFSISDEKALVASGEQSFLYMMVKGRLPPGKYQTITPCFRNERNGVFHKKYFMKNELINTEDTSEKALDEMVILASEFFKLFGEVTTSYEKHHGSLTGRDLFLNEIEVGSYGIRQHEYLKWVYGTGVAEPRLSRAMNSDKSVARIKY